MVIASLWWLQPVREIVESEGSARAKQLREGSRIMMTSGGEIRKLLLARGKQMIQNFWESSPQC